MIIIISPKITQKHYKLKQRFDRLNRTIKSLKVKFKTLRENKCNVKDKNKCLKNNIGKALKNRKNRNTKNKWWRPYNKRIKRNNKGKFRTKNINSFWRLLKAANLYMF